MLRTLELHVIQSLPTSRTNRDRTGTPKTIVYGGVPRVRQSSQSEKRAQRTAGDQAPNAYRTKVPQELILPLLPEDLAAASDTRRIIMDVLQERFGDYDEKGRLKAVAYLGQDEVQRYATQIAAQLPQLQALRHPTPQEPQPQAYTTAVTTLVQELDSRTESPDIALFGRFIAEDRASRVEAATSYSHAISTHRANVISDFFTAIDDVTGNVNHLSDTDHAAPTLYRCAVLDLEQLQRNLVSADPEQVTDLAQSWAEGYIHATPSGGQHGAFAHTLPEYVLIIARVGGHPVSLATAFVEPAFPQNGETLVQVSIRKLREQHEANTRVYGHNGHVLAQDVSTLPSTRNEGGPESLAEALQQALAFLALQ